MANTAKLLLLQGGRCFYCNDSLALEDATLEHIVPKAQGGDASEGNTVACCASMNHLLGNATPKEKLAAVINARGPLVCPRKSASKNAKSTAPHVASTSAPTASKATQHIGLDSLREDLDSAYDAASAMHAGSKANLSALGVELRKRLPDFSARNYGHKLFGNLVKALGYQVDGQWSYRKR